MTERMIINSSTDRLELHANALMVGDAIDISELVIQQPNDFAGRDSYLLEVRGSNCQIGKIIIMGGADDGSKGNWMETCCSAVTITGNDNIIGTIECAYVHIPLLVTGVNNRVGSLRPHLYSGDTYNLANHHNKIYQVCSSGLLDIYPYEQYHQDLGGMIYPSRPVSECLLGCEVWNLECCPVGHPLEAIRPQGFVGDNKTADCLLVNISLPDVHAEHGISFADATSCTLINIETNGAISWDRKSKGYCDARGNCHV